MKLTNEDSENCEEYFFIDQKFLMKHIYIYFISRK